MKKVLSPRSIRFASEHGPLSIFPGTVVSAAPVLNRKGDG